jgi:hypothetical protein
MALLGSVCQARNFVKNKRRAIFSLMLFGFGRSADSISVSLVTASAISRACAM